MFISPLNAVDYMEKVTIVLTFMSLINCLGFSDITDSCILNAQESLDLSLSLSHGFN